MAFVSPLPISASAYLTTSTTTSTTSRPSSLSSKQCSRLTTRSSSSFTQRNRLTSTTRTNKTINQATRMLVVDVGSTTEMDTVLDNADESLVVVDYSTSWCGPCKIFAPIFEELSEKYKDVVFVKVMGDASPDASELMRREGIRAVPAFHFWKEKKRIKDITGAKKDDVETSIKEFLKSEAI